MSDIEAQEEIGGVANGWRPIETAPKGEPVKYARGPQVLGVVIRDEWKSYNIVSWHWHANAKTGSWKGPFGVWEPDYWMPLPAPPIPQTQDKEASE